MSILNQDQQRSDDQQAIAKMHSEEWVARLRAFSCGELQIWSDERKLRDFANGEWVTLTPGQWLEVRDASALFVRGAKYRIVGEESWRVPTDEDAKQRPVARMRDADQEPWKKGTLIAVNDLLDRDHNYLVHHGNNVFEWFMQCEILDNAEATTNA